VRRLDQIEAGETNEELEEEKEVNYDERELEESEGLEGLEGSEDKQNKEEEDNIDNQRDKEKRKELTILKENHHNAAMVAKIEEEKVKGKKDEISTLELWIKNLTILKKKLQSNKKILECMAIIQSSREPCTKAGKKEYHYFCGHHKRLAENPDWVLVVAMVGLELTNQEEKEEEDREEEEISFAESVEKIFAKDHKSAAVSISDKAREKMMEKLEKLKRELEKLGKSEATASTALEIAQSKLHTAVGPRESKFWKIIIQELKVNILPFQGNETFYFYFFEMKILNFN